MTNESPSDSDWPFEDDPDVAVFTSKAVLEERRPIELVFHDLEDGSWQIFSMEGAPADISDARLVSLREILNMEPSLRLLADLPEGWKAWRKAPSDLWVRKKIADVEDN